MQKSIFALLLIFISLLVITPKLWAQPTCVEANGLLWCYNDQACGQACNDVCAALGLQPIADDSVWFEAQNSVEKCQAISQALGLGNVVNVSSWTHACLEDELDNPTVGGGLNAPLYCSIYDGCPADHRTDMDDLGIPCGPGSRRSICPCVSPPSINLSPTTATADIGTDHTVTATVDSDGIPAPGVLVTFEVNSGPNAGKVSNPNNGECSPNDDCTTDENGQVSWTYSSRFPGTDIIAASYTDLSGRVIASDPVEIIWESVPIPTLSQWGVIAMAGVLGIICLLAIRRKKATA